MTKWEQSSRVGGRLTAFVSSAEGEKLIHIFRAKRLDPEVFPFLLCSFIWPVERLKTAPPRKAVADVAKLLRKAARALAELERQDCGVHYPEQLRRDLLQQAKRMTDANIPVGRVGNLKFGSQRELRGKKDVAKRMVVLFLVGYLREVGHIESGMWPIITQFLIATGMEAPSTKSKNLASWWSSCMKRDGAGEASLKKHQAGLMLLFDEAKRDVHARYIAS